MKNTANYQDLCEFFHIDPEKEPSQKFILHNREEVARFEELLNKHQEAETHLDFHRLNLTQAYDYCQTLNNSGGKLFAALLDLKITMTFVFIDSIQFSPDYNSINRKDGPNILEDEALFNKKIKMLHHNIDLAIRYRAFYDKLMGVVVMLVNPSKYNDYLSAKSRKSIFPQLVKGYFDKESIDTLISHITYLDEKYRTPEVHQTGSMRTWIFSSEDLFLDKQINLMNYFNAVIGAAEWIDRIIAYKLG